MLLGTLDATQKVPNIPVSLQGNTEVPGVSTETFSTFIGEGGNRPHPEVCREGHETLPDKAEESTTLDATPKFPNIPVSLQGNTEVPGVSREVPYSVLKCETVLDTLDATAKVPRHAGFPRGEHRGSRHHFI